MKKFSAVVFCFSVCLAVALIFPQVGTSNLYVDSSSECLNCHVVDFGSTDSDEQHVMHSGIDCGSCHEGGMPQAGNVKAQACTVCHLEKCESVNTHESEQDADCLSCHVDCQSGPTTTTPTTTPETPCPSKEIYGENSIEVEILRYIRDNVLSQTSEGREVIKLYYQWSPLITMAIRNDDELRAEAKELIDGILLLNLE